MFNPFKKAVKAAAKTVAKNASKASSVTKNKIVTSGKGAVPITKKQAVVDKMKYASPKSPTVGKYQNKMYASRKDAGKRIGRLQGMAIGAGAAGVGAAIGSGKATDVLKDPIVISKSKPVAKAPVKSAAKPAAPSKSAAKPAAPAKKAAPATKRKLKF